MSLSGLFVTGTDTEVGKTTIAVAILRALRSKGVRTGALKPIASSGIADGEGGFRSPDGDRLLEALDDYTPPGRVAPIVLPGDVAPSVAIQDQGLSIRLTDILASSQIALKEWAETAEVVIVEGAGGWLCPIAPDATIADLAVRLDFPVVVVARRGLGTINHTLLTVESILARGVRVAGIVLNGASPLSEDASSSTNAREIAARVGPVPILADILHGESDAARTLDSFRVDWLGLARPPRLGHGAERGASLDA